MGLFDVFAVYKEDSTAPVYLQLLRGIWAYMRCSYLFLLGFGMGTMLAIFHMCGIMLMLIADLNMLVTNASPRCPLCLGARCLVCQDLESCHFCFVLLPHRPELGSV